ncbi:sugar ABC transporter substrate-binding protein [Candidatus Bipolaricaulota bacterium]|nr:sugar ABC transporter substrate-binding protein [Candidatus Bipolaricaulota bacterium]
MLSKKGVLLLSITLILSLVAFPGLAQKELTFSDWHLTEPIWEQSLKEGVAMFEAANPDIDVKLEYVSYGEKESKYASAFEAGQGPDIYHLHGFSISSFINRGYTYDITEFVEQAGETWYGEDFTDPWFDKTIDLLKRDGKYYGLPGDFMPMVLFYNKDLFREAGLDPTQPPETWAEFLEYAKKLTRDTNEDGNIDTWGFGTVGAISPGFELRFTPVLYSHGGRFLTEDNKCSALNSDAAKEAIEFFVNLKQEHGVIPPGVTSQNPGNVREQMAQKQVAMLMGSGWTAPIVDGLNPDWNAFEVLEPAPIPSSADKDVDVTTTAWISAWFIGENTDNPEAAWKLLKHQTSKPMTEKWFRDNRVLSSRKDVSGGLEGINGYNELLNDKFAQVMAGEMEKAKFVPQVKEWPQIIETVNVAVQKGFTGTDPLMALETAHNQINDILSVYRDEGETCPAF